MADLKAPATVDDISVIVIPVYNYYKDFCQWEKLYFEAQNKREQERNRVLQASSALIVNDLGTTTSNSEATEDDEDVEEATEDQQIEEATDIVDEALKQINLNDASSSESTA